MSSTDGTCDYCWRPAKAHGHYDHKPIFHDKIIEAVVAEVEASQPPMTGPEFDGEDFLMRLASAGGSIVCTSALTPEQINAARDEGRMYVNEDGFGFVHAPPLAWEDPSMADRTRTVEGVLHFLTPQQMAEEIVRLDALLADARRLLEHAGCPTDWMLPTMGRLPVAPGVPAVPAFHPCSFCKTEDACRTRGCADAAAGREIAAGVEGNGHHTNCHEPLMKDDPT